MGKQVKVGDRAVSRKWGPCIVVEVGSKRVSVRPDSMPIVVASSVGDLGVDDPTTGYLPITPTGPVAGDATARRGIEALRFGLVPGEQIEAMTVGIDEIGSWIEGRLAHRSGRPTFCEVWGPFGTGKSHTMALVRSIASRNGYLTAHVEVDGVHVSLSDPKRLLSALWRTLRVDGTLRSTPILDLYLTAIESEVCPAPVDGGSDSVGDNYRAVRMMHRFGCLDDWASELEALFSCSLDVTVADVRHAIVTSRARINYSEFTLRSLIGIPLIDRPRDFMACLAGYALLAEAAGARGLVITIDEFEVELTGGRDRRDRIERLLVAVRDYFGGYSSLRAAPLSVFVAAVGQDDRAGDQLLATIVGDTGGHSYSLHEVDAEERSALGEKVITLYSRAYGVEIREREPFLDRAEKEAEASGLGHSGVVRSYVKTLVAICDAQYGPKP